MAGTRYEGSERFRPIGAWGYVGYTLLLSLPVIGPVLALAFACSSARINRRNYARAMLLMRLTALGLTVGLLLSSEGVRDWMKTALPRAETVIRLFEQTRRAADADAPPMTANTPGTEKTPSASPKPGSVRTAAPTSVPGSPQRGSAPAGIRQNVREAIDGLEAFFREYAAFMKGLSSSHDGVGMTEEYLRMLALYAENAEKWASFEDDHDLNDAEALYYAEAALRIEGYLLEALQP